MRPQAGFRIFQRPVIGTSAPTAASLTRKPIICRNTEIPQPAVIVQPRPERVATEESPGKGAFGLRGSGDRPSGPAPQLTGIAQAGQQHTLCIMFLVEGWRVSRWVQTPALLPSRKASPVVSMDVSTRECEGQVVAAMRGELDVVDAASVAAAFAAVAARERNVIVDLAGSYPDSASSITAASTNCLRTEPIWNRVYGVHSAPVSTSAGPTAGSSTTAAALATIAAPHRTSPGACRDLSRRRSPASAAGRAMAGTVSRRPSRSGRRGRNGSSARRERDWMLVWAGGVDVKSL
jgi:hypothetical protein